MHIEVTRPNTIFTYLRLQQYNATREVCGRDVMFNIAIKHVHFVWQKFGVEHSQEIIIKLREMLNIFA